MLNNIYLIVGVPASGKSWVCNQLREQCEYIAHDDHIAIPSAYLRKVLFQLSKCPTKAVLIEAPFSMGIMDDLLAKGYFVQPVFVIEKESVLRERYRLRGRNEEHIIRGHLTRQETYRLRAINHKAFAGDSSAVLTYLREQLGRPEIARKND